MSDGKGKGVGVGKNSGTESESQIPKGSSRETKSSTRRRLSKEPCVSKPTDFPGALNAPRAARASVAVGENLPTGVTSVADPLSLGDGLVSDGVDHSVPDSDDDPLMVVDKETCVSAGPAVAAPVMGPAFPEASVPLITVHGETEVEPRALLGNPEVEASGSPGVHGQYRRSALP